MSGKKGFRIFINVLTVISVWFFIAGFVNIINVVNAEQLFRHGVEVEGEIINYELRVSGGGGKYGYRVYFTCKYVDAVTGKTYFAETYTKSRYPSDKAENIGRESLGDKIALVISGSLCAAERDVEREYVFAVLITVFLTVGGAAIITWRIAYEILSDKKRKKSKAVAEGEKLSAESQLY